MLPLSSNLISEKFHDQTFSMADNNLTKDTDLNQMDFPFVGKRSVCVKSAGLAYRKGCISQWSGLRAKHQSQPFGSCPDKNVIPVGLFPGAPANGTSFVTRSVLHKKAFK
jgi:hypothetical protein